MHFFDTFPFLLFVDLICFLTFQFDRIAWTIVPGTEKINQ